MTHCIMRADKLLKYSIMVGLWRVFPIWTTVQHFGHNNLIPIETLVKNSVDNRDAGTLQVKKVLLLILLCYKQCDSYLLTCLS